MYAGTTAQANSVRWSWTWRAAWPSDKTRLYASTKFGLKAQGPWRPAAPGSRGVGRLGRAGRPAIQLTRSMPPLASKVETRPHSTA
jgi:hypothetical protein